MKKIKGYKAFTKDLTCNGFQYEIGKEYKYRGEINICLSGFHFCKTIADCYKFYPMNKETRICKVKAWGTILTDEDNVKYVTDHIRIVKEEKNPREKSNLLKSSTGYSNRGGRNSGNHNIGDRNSGSCNSGDNNSGSRNSGYKNSGSQNSGDWNSGDMNSGSSNSGYWNSGVSNSGHKNSGSRNSGDRNIGYRNSGDWNSGVFNTDKNPKIKMFDKDSSWTIDDWINSDARTIMSRCPYSHSVFIDESDMTGEEKENYPKYKIIGGYVKVFNVSTEDRQKWWNELTEGEKDTIKALPNFDAEKFCKCIGIDHI